MTSRTGSSGFTLIEVLVASVILFAGLGAVLKAYSLAVVAMDSAMDKLNSCQVMREKAMELEPQVTGTLGDPLTGGDGRTVIGSREYLWHIETSRLVLTHDVSLLRAAIRVNRSMTGQPYTLVCEWAQIQTPEKAGAP
ncbi:MAG: prepilin-type N-terminal cleavage/methylation domain-containing protein [bacterium]